MSSSRLPSSSSTTKNATPLPMVAGTLQTDPRSGGIKRSSGVNVLPIVAESTSSRILSFCFDFALECRMLWRFQSFIVACAHPWLRCTPYWVQNITAFAFEILLLQLLRYDDDKCLENRYTNPWNCDSYFVSSLEPSSRWFQPCRRLVDCWILAAVRW